MLVLALVVPVARAAGGPTPAGEYNNSSTAHVYLNILVDDPGNAVYVTVTCDPEGIGPSTKWVWISHELRAPLTGTSSFTIAKSDAVITRIEQRTAKLARGRGRVSVSGRFGDGKFVGSAYVGDTPCAEIHYSARLAGSTGPGALPD